MEKLSHHKAWQGVSKSCLSFLCGQAVPLLADREVEEQVYASGGKTSAGISKIFLATETCVCPFLHFCVP